MKLDINPEISLQDLQEAFKTPPTINKKRRKLLSCLRKNKTINADLIPYLVRDGWLTDANGEISFTMKAQMLFYHEDLQKKAQNDKKLERKRQKAARTGRRNTGTDQQGEGVGNVPVSDVGSGNSDGVGIVAGMGAEITDPGGKRNVNQDSQSSGTIGTNPTGASGNTDEDGVSKSDGG